MATTIEPCPFCRSDHLHITQNGISFCIVCESCKSKGPHSSALDNAIGRWNLAYRRRPGSGKGLLNTQHPPDPQPIPVSRY